MRRIAMISSAFIAGMAGLVLAGSTPEPAISGPEPGLPEGEPALRVEKVLVRFEKGADAGERAATREAAETEFEKTLPVRGLQLVDPEPGTSVGEAIKRLERSPEVLYAEPDAVRRIGATPNDEFFDVLWGLHNTGQAIPEGSTDTGTPDADIDAPEAWDATTGSSSTTVAVADTGIQYSHTDLDGNIWSNPGETPGNGADDDGNGFIDDTRGWDFVTGDNNAQDGNGHGTHVSGTIGAEGNNGQVGVAGVNWDTSLMPLRVLDNNGDGFVSDLIEAYGYADANGADVLNASLSGPVGLQAEQDAISAASDVLFVFAAGNEGVDNDLVPSFPCNYNLSNVVCVAATDKDDALADFSNYGATTVDLGAPGVDIGSTWTSNTWVYSDGTSMAAPHVTGVAALAFSVSPTAAPATVRTALLDNVDPKPSLAGKTVTGGRLNASGTLGGLGAAASGSGGGGTPSGGSPPSGSAPPSSSSPPLGSTTTPRRPPSSSSGTDRTAPSLGLRVGVLQRLASVLRRGLPIRVRCSEACTVRADLIVSGAVARRLRIRASARSVVLGRGRASLTRAGTVTLRIRLTATAKRRLRRLRSMRASVRIIAADRSGNPSRATRRVRLRR